MVGVPGRSKACHTCKIRKKRCDFERPICRQCRRLGIECAGYERKPIFVNATQLAQRSRYASSIPRAATALHLAAYSNQCIEVLCGAYFPNGRELSFEASQYTICSWMMLIQGSDTKNDFLKFALMANSVCMNSTIKGRRDSLAEGRKLYGRSLRLLANGLQNLEDSDWLSLIMASRLLSIFEILFGGDTQDEIAQARAWNYHSAGERCLLFMGGPERYRSGNAHQLFVDGRLHLVIPDIWARKASLLAKPDWKTIPWQDTPKTAKDELIDVLVEIPGLLEHVDYLQTFSHADKKKAELHQQLVNRLLLLDRDLRIWYNSFGSRLDLTTEKIMVDTRRPPSGEELAAAHLLVIYWCCLLLYNQVRQALPQADVPQSHSLKTLCKNILRVIRVFLGLNSGWYGINIAAFPLGLVLRHLDEWDLTRESYEERSIIYEIFQHHRGLELWQFLASMRQKRSAISTPASGNFGIPTRRLEHFPTL